MSKCSGAGAGGDLGLVGTCGQWGPGPGGDLGPVGIAFAFKMGSQMVEKSLPCLQKADVGRRWRWVFPPLPETPSWTYGWLEGAWGHTHMGTVKGGFESQVPGKQSLRQGFSCRHCIWESSREQLERL